MRTLCLVTWPRRAVCRSVLPCLVVFLAGTHCLVVFCSDLFLFHTLCQSRAVKAAGMGVEMMARTEDTTARNEPPHDDDDRHTRRDGDKFDCGSWERRRGWCETRTGSIKHSHIEPGKSPGKKRRMEKTMSSADKRREQRGIQLEASRPGCRARFRGVPKVNKANILGWPPGPSRPARPRLTRKKSRWRVYGKDAIGWRGDDPCDLAPRRRRLLHERWDLFISPTCDCCHGDGVGGLHSEMVAEDHMDDG